jgi:SAM-dependent methyltransferase
LRTAWATPPIVITPPSGLGNWVVAVWRGTGKITFMTQDDRQKMRAYYDEFGNAEWERLEKDINGRVSLEVHRQFLTRFISQGDRVLEIGAGPGRFTMELADLGARVAVTDFSPIQLDLNRFRLADSTSVESWEILDVCDTSTYADGEFDAVVAYGGPLSYAFENIDEAMTGLFRIVRPGGVVVASVMSLLGTWRHLLEDVITVAETFGDDANDAILRTGDLRHIGGAHVCQMFRASDITNLVQRCGGEMLAMSASNWASLDKPEALASLESDPDRWRRFLEHEAAACAEPGALDGGTHLLFAARSVIAN